MEDTIIEKLSKAYGGRNVDKLNESANFIFNEGENTAVSKRFTFFRRREKYTKYYLLYIYKLNSMQDKLTYFVHGGEAWLRNILPQDYISITNSTDDTVEFIEKVMDKMDKNVLKGVSILPQNWDISIFCEESEYENIFTELQQFVGMLDEMMNLDKNSSNSELTRKDEKAKTKKGKFNYDKEKNKFTKYYTDNTADSGYCTSVFNRKDFTPDFLGNPIILCRYKELNNGQNQDNMFRDSDCDGCDKKISGENNENPGFTIIWSSMHQIPNLDEFKTNYIQKITNVVPAAIILPKKISNMTLKKFIKNFWKTGPKHQSKTRKWYKKQLSDSIPDLKLNFRELTCRMLSDVGLMMNTTLMDSQNVNRSTTKKIDIDNFRMEMVLQEYKPEKILYGYKNLGEIWRNTFGVWRDSDRKKFFHNDYEYMNMVKVINSKILSRTILPSGISKEIELETDTMTSHRAIINTIVIDLSNFFKTYVHTDIYSVDVFIVGGDSWGRYIEARTSDIDIKVIVTPIDATKAKKHEITGGWLIPDNISAPVQWEIGRILSKYIVYLNYVSKNTERSYRLREYNSTKTDSPFYLMSLDFREYHNLSKYDLPKSYPYELPILDISTVFNDTGSNYTEMYNNMPLNLSGLDKNLNLPNYISFKQYALYNLVNMRLPVANKKFLKSDIDRMYKTSKSFQRRYYANKMRKDVTRYDLITASPNDNQNTINNVIDPVISISLLENVYPYSVNMTPYPCMYFEYYLYMGMMKNRSKTKNKMPYNITKSDMCLDNQTELRIMTECNNVPLTEQNYAAFCDNNLEQPVFTREELYSLFNEFNNVVNNYDKSLLYNGELQKELKEIEKSEYLLSGLRGGNSVTYANFSDMGAAVHQDSLKIYLKGTIYKSTDNIVWYIREKGPYFFSGTIEDAEMMRLNRENTKTYALFIKEPLNLFHMSEENIDTVIKALDDGIVQGVPKTLLGAYYPKYTPGYEMRLALGYKVTCKEQGDFIDDIERAKHDHDFRLDIDYLKNDGWEEKREGCDDSKDMKRLMIDKLNYIISYNICAGLDKAEYDGFIINESTSSYGFDQIFPYQIVLCSLNKILNYAPVITQFDRTLIAKKRDLISDRGPPMTIVERAESMAAYRRRQLSPISSEVKSREVKNNQDNSDWQPHPSKWDNVEDKKDDSDSDWQPDPSKWAADSSWIDSLFQDKTDWKPVKSKPVKSKPVKSKWVIDDSDMMDDE
jgi:hypothetical protein